MTATADLLDEHPDAAVCDLVLRQFGGVAAFDGAIATVRCFEDNVLVKQCVSEPGAGRVLVVDGGGSLRVALVGDNVASTARDNGWAGLVIHGCVRDSASLRELPIGIMALGTHPKPSGKSGEGETGVPVTFGGVTFLPGNRVAADDDGLVVLAGWG
ncbi:MAG: regulator of ribonuclease [Gaiellaceae bacterium]|nr:regulator of ribonuclease [Gaiellaceae bacterium]